jgi:hypothetical protein
MHSTVCDVQSLTRGTLWDWRCETRNGPNGSDRAVADLVGVSNTFVGNIRKELGHGQVSTVDTSTSEPGQIEAGVKALHPADSKRVGKDGKAYPAAHPKPPVSADAEDPDFDYPDDADKFDTAKFDEPKEIKIKPPMANGAPVVDSMLGGRILTNLSLLSRQLWEFDKPGLYNKHNKAMSALIEDVRVKIGMKPLPVAGPAPAEEPVPF